MHRLAAFAFVAGLCAGCGGAPSGPASGPGDPGGGTMPNPGTSGGSDAGGGTVPMGSVGPNGGTVPRLYFAVIGDTRPGSIDATSSYPTPIITKIYSDIAAMVPRPQFVVTTGDYMFASPFGNEAARQMALYIGAQKQFTDLGSVVFAAMGNHECTGATGANCAQQTTNNYTAFMDNLVKPLGRTSPYYTVDFNDTNGQWTAKLVVTACNAWDTNQANWLTGELAKPTTYTFVVRHEPTGTYGTPCGNQMDGMLRQSKYDLMIVGHTHTFEHSGNEVIIGNGGAPITGGAVYGYATVEQQAGGGFLVTQFDYQSAMPVSTFMVN